MTLILKQGALNICFVHCLNKMAKCVNYFMNLTRDSKGIEWPQLQNILTFGLNIFYLNYLHTYMFSCKDKQTYKLGFERKLSAY